MKKLHLPIKVMVFVCVLFAGVALFGTGQALAATKTWTGEGSDNDFSTAANWSGNSAPVNGDSIVLPYDVVMDGCSAGNDVTLNNDLDSASITLAGINTSATKPEGCYGSVVITGNEVKTSGDIIGNAGAQSASPYLKFDVPITTTAEINIHSVNSQSSLSIGANDVTIKSASFSESLSGSGTLTITGFPSGGGGAGGCISVPRSYPFEGNSSGFSGSIVVGEYGILTVSDNADDIAHHADGITLEDGLLNFSMSYGQDLVFDQQITFNGGSIHAGQLGSDSCSQPTSATTVTLEGAVAITQTMNYTYHWASVLFTGTVSGQQHITVPAGQSTEGSLTLPDGTVLRSPLRTTLIDETNKVSYCSDTYGLVSTIAFNNRYIVNVSCSGSNPAPFSVYGILSGVGQFNNPTHVYSAGVIAPGESPGVLTVGGLTFEEGGIYEWEVAGTGEGQYDQIIVNGTVNLANGTLSVVSLEGYQPAAGDKFIIVNNDGSDAVEGTFANLPEGATVEIGGVLFTISYIGGDGNDVELFAVPGTPVTGNFTDHIPTLIMGAIGFGAALYGGLMGRKFFLARQRR